MFYLFVTLLNLHGVIIGRVNDVKKHDFNEVTLWLKLFKLFLFIFYNFLSHTESLINLSLKYRCRALYCTCAPPRSYVIANKFLICHFDVNFQN